MAYTSLIPTSLQALEERDRFLVWLRSMPITFHQRLRIYFDFLDLHQASYTPEEINSLNDVEPVVDTDTPD